MAVFEHLIKFEDIIFKVDNALLDIDPMINTVDGKLRYSKVNQKERDNLAFNILIATGFYVIHDLQQESYIKTSIEDAVIDVDIDNILWDKVIKKPSVNQILSDLHEYLYLNK